MFIWIDCPIIPFPSLLCIFIIASDISRYLVPLWWFQHVSCGNVSLESSYEKVGRCVYTSTLLFECGELGLKPVDVKESCFGWRLAYSEVWNIARVILKYSTFLPVGDDVNHRMKFNVSCFLFRFVTKESWLFLGDVLFFLATSCLLIMLTVWRFSDRKFNMSNDKHFLIQVLLQFWWTRSHCLFLDFNFASSPHFETCFFPFNVMFWLYIKDSFALHFRYISSLENHLFKCRIVSCLFDFKCQHKVFG